jgi:rod shape-determining protein MreD
MITSNRQYILRPVSPPFIAFSLAFALVLNFLPWGQRFWVPDFVALVLVFWNTHHPRKVGIGVAFLMGVLVDVNDATLLGQHALAYTLLSYGAIMAHRRVLWFSLITQAVHVMPLFVIAQVVSLAVRFVGDGSLPNPLVLIESLVTASLWPLASWLLMAPQRRPQDRDVNRPI